MSSLEDLLLSYFVGFSTLGVEMFDRNITVFVPCYFVGLVLYPGRRDV